MSSFRRFAFLLALSFTLVTAVVAQSTDSSSNPAPNQTQNAQTQATEPPAPTSGELSVQARIRARRAERRAAAIKEAYNNRFEAYGGMGYLRFEPGSTLERAHEYAWDTGFTSYRTQRLGVTADARGYYATAFVGVNSLTNSAITNPAISQVAFLAGPTYRLYLHPKYSVSARVLAGIDHGNFSGDTNHSTVIATELGLWPDGYTFAASASVPVDYNLTPHVGFRVAPEYFLTGFGSTTQNSLGFTLGMVYRFGKQ